VPLVLLLAAMVALAPEHKDTSAGQARAFEPSRRFRAVVFILDSAGKSEMFDPELMPFLSSLRTSSLSGRSRPCAAKATFPCIKSIFEGRAATMGTVFCDVEMPTGSFMFGSILLWTPPAEFHILPACSIE
jgi:hypothetical protein